MLCLLTWASWAKDGKKLILIAGKPSHPPLMHEFRAGCLLLEKCLQNVEGLTVEVPAGIANEEFKSWIGGHYENMYSCNPIWAPRFDVLPEHPVTRGVIPFSISDEWYFNMRFIGGIAGNEPHEEGGLTFTPILVAKPSDDVRDGPYVYPQGPYDHIVASSGRDEAMLWVVERPDGGRGFGFTSGHFHMNWGNESFRKVVLNTLNWVTKNEVPKQGIESKITVRDLHRNLDKKQEAR